VCVAVAWIHSVHVTQLALWRYIHVTKVVFLGRTNNKHDHYESVVIKVKVKVFLSTPGRRMG